MSCYILCLTLDGIPLFCRTKGNLPSLPFSAMGPLNAVHTFSKNHDVNLLNTTTDNARIYWKEVNANIKLISVNFEKDVSDFHLDILLQTIFNAMVMCVGLSDLEDVSNIGRLKKQLRACYPIIDSFLSHTDIIGDICQYPDVILCPESNMLQECLDTFSNSCGSEFSCILVHKRIAVASEKWWQLKSYETLIILFLVSSLQVSDSRDIPIYLPHGSPDIPHRLITISLVENVQMLLICGPQPSLHHVVNRYMKSPHLTSTIQILRAATRSYPRNFPPEIKLDANLLGFIIINSDKGKCFSSLYPQGHTTGAESSTLSSAERRLKTLISFYHSVVSRFFPSVNSFSEPNRESVCETGQEISDVYRCIHSCKCCALQTSNHTIFTIFSNDIPTYALSNVTLMTLKRFTRDKFI